MHHINQSGQKDVFLVRSMDHIYIIGTCLNDFNKNVNNSNVVLFDDSMMRDDVLAKIYLIDGKFAISNKINISHNTVREIAEIMIKVTFFIFISNNAQINGKRVDTIT